MRFLLVEDDDDHAHLVERHLRRDPRPNELDRASDGAEALAILRQRPPYEAKARPDIILLDLKLPKVDGLEVLEAVKEDPDLSAIPVVIMSTSDAERDRTKAYALHANSYLVKPIDYENFRQMVTDLLNYWGVWNRLGSDSS